MKFSLEKIKKQKIEKAEILKKKRSLIEAIERTKKQGFNPVIAEIKQASPSLGNIKKVEVEKAAREMEQAGACGISVLTDKNFKGCLGDLVKVKETVKIPVLQKEFIVNEFQLRQAYYLGADAVLLIASLLKEKTKDFVKIIHHLGMEALVEIHSEKEIDFALNSGAKLIGINNRDLKTLKVLLETTEKLAGKIPPEKIVVSESGIKSRGDLERVIQAGAEATLIGSSIMLSKTIKEKVKEFVRANIKRSEAP